MNIAMDKQWNHEAGNFAMDNNNDYEKAFESYISDVDDDDEGKVKTLYGQYFLLTLLRTPKWQSMNCAFGCHEINYPQIVELTQLHTTKSVHKQ
jgi:hypothetical protein